MICNKCGSSNTIDSQFCSHCGNKLNEITNEQMKTINNNQKNDKNKKIIIGILLGVLLILLIIAISLCSNNKSANTRTVMIYVAGNDLESNAEIVTADLAAIKPQNIDLSKTNILLYTGGTKEWHNFVKNDENAIYILKSTGFKKLESQKQYNFGDSETLSNFLKYAYNNYKADKFDLVLYNHGGAIDGAIYDELSGDNLSLQDMTDALNTSPFNENNKLEAVLFRTCLNGTIELANIFSPYAKYLIGSEEVSWGSKYSNVLGFLNNVSESDDGKAFGTKFIESYEQQMTEIDPYGTVTHTYSVIDLSKIDNINKQLDEYISGLDLSKNYNDIVKIRTDAYQYGQEARNYDMIDLYDFIAKTSEYSTKDSKKLLETIESAVIYNETNEKDSHGLSIYFPYNGGKGQKYKYINEVYSHLDYSNNYKTFINTFNKTRTDSKPFSFNINDKSVIETTKENQMEIQLTKEQINNYAYSTFTIFKQDIDHPNYYYPIYNSDDTTLDKNGKLKIDYTNKLTKVLDEDTGKYQYVLTYHRNRNNQNQRTTDAILYDKDYDISDGRFMSRATLYLADTSNKKLTVSMAKLKSNNERINGAVLNIDDYETYEIWTNSYRILDDKGNVLDTSEWESSPTLTGFSGKLSELEFEYTNLDKGNRYYALFIITDINGNTSYSKLIKVGE